MMLRFEKTKLLCIIIIILTYCFKIFNMKEIRKIIEKLGISAILLYVFDFWEWIFCLITMKIT